MIVIVHILIIINLSVNYFQSEVVVINVLIIYILFPKNTLFQFYILFSPNFFEIKLVQKC